MKKITSRKKLPFDQHFSMLVDQIQHEANDYSKIAIPIMSQVADPDLNF